MQILTRERDLKLRNQQDYTKYLEELKFSGCTPWVRCKKILQTKGPSFLSHSNEFHEWLYAYRLERNNSARYKLRTVFAVEIWLHKCINWQTVLWNILSFFTQTFCVNTNDSTPTFQLSRRCTSYRANQWRKPMTRSQPWQPRGGHIKLTFYFGWCGALVGFRGSLRF
jgi:hypothetical protein